MPGEWNRTDTNEKQIGAGLIPVDEQRQVAATRRVDDSVAAFDEENMRPQFTEAEHGSERVCPSHTEAESIIADLTARRAKAVMERDSAGLATIYELDSTGREADQRLIETLWSDDMEIRDFSTGIADVKVSGCGDLITVEATMSQSEYTRCRSGVCTQVAAVEPRPTQFNLSGPPWRVVTVYELPAETEMQS